MNKSNIKTFNVAYLGIVPVPHKSEGLNVLLCDTIKPLMANGIHIKVHTTPRHYNAICNALTGNDLDLEEIEIIKYRVESLTLRALLFINGRGKSKDHSPDSAGWFTKKRKKVTQSCRGSFVSLANWLLDLTYWNLLFKLAAFVVILIVTAAMGSLTALLATFGSLLLAPFVLIRFVRNRFIGYISRFPKLREYCAKYVRAYRNKKKDFRVKLVGHLYANEQIRFSKALNRSKRVKRLFFFTSFDGHAVANFKGDSLVVMPDIVTSIYPLRFVGSHNAAQLQEMSLAVANAKAIVCYSEYVRDNQLIRIFPEEVRDKHIEVIPQGYFLPSDNDCENNLPLLRELNKHRSLIKNCFPDLLLKPPVIDFTQFDYIVYPTIDRAHKNTLTLVRAFEKLLRTKYRNIKLVLTTPYPTADVYNYITDNRLHYDVLFMPSVPIDVLDKLFRGASLMVHPSLAEGGDVFNFSRAAVAEVPALLADVPVVLEMFTRGNIPSEIYTKWIFDPVDADALARRIDEVLDDPSQIISTQKRAVKNLSKYGFNEMAARYYNLYESM